MVCQQQLRSPQVGGMFDVWGRTDWPARRFQSVGPDRDKLPAQLDAWNALTLPCQLVEFPSAVRLASPIDRVPHSPDERRMMHRHIEIASRLSVS
jgi:hypothetical protein